SKGGVLVADVMKDGPAEAAGMKAGDVIVELGGAPIKEVTELQKRVAAIPPGRPIALTVLRDRKPTKLTVKIGEQPGEETGCEAGCPAAVLTVTEQTGSHERRRFPSKPRGARHRRRGGRSRILPRHFRGRVRGPRGRPGRQGTRGASLATGGRGPARRAHAG